MKTMGRPPSSLGDYTLRKSGVGKTSWEDDDKVSVPNACNPQMPRKVPPLKLRRSLFPCQAIKYDPYRWRRWDVK